MDGEHSEQERGPQRALRPVSDTRPAEEDGIDVSLIPGMLSLTPLERLQVMQDHVRAYQELRDRNPTWTS